MMNTTMNKKEQNRFIFSALSYQDDIVIPEFKEDRFKEWVKYGDDNKFPEELLNVFNKSGIHNAIIESKTRMICGDGVIQNDEVEFSDRTQQFIDHPNKYESLDDVLKKISMDYEIYGLAYLEIIWGKGHKQIAEINHIDASKIRWGKANDKNRVDMFWFSKDWNNYRKNQYQPIGIPIFNDETKDARQILPIIRYTPGLDYYSYPDYIGGLKWIHIDTEIGNYHFNNLKNGLTPSVFFGFPVGETTDDERKTIEEKIKAKYTGTNNAGKFILSFYDAEGDSKPEVKVIEPSNSDKLYDLLNKTTLQQILIAHKITNENLVGISTPGKLGNSNELLNAYDVYFNTVIKPEQKKLIDTLNRIFLINGFNEINILNNKPFDFNLSESALLNILTPDELRDLIGYEPLDQIENPSSGTTTGVTMEFGVRTIDKNNYQVNLEKANLDDLYKWDLRNQKNPCPSCKSFSGTVRTLREWKELAIPGVPSGFNFGNERTTFPYGDGKFGTFCEADCQCRLVKVGTIKK